MPTEIYIDILFLVNFAADYFLLLGTARMMRYPVRRLRLVMAAAIGALYAVLIFFPFFRFGICILMKAAISVVMIFVAFGYGKKKLFLKLLLCFYFISFLFGGTIGGLSTFTGIGAAIGLKISNGALYLNFPIWLLIGYILFSYVLLLAVNKITTRRGDVDSRLYQVEVYMGEKSVKFAAIADSGNLLTSLTGQKPVMIAEREILLPLFGGNLPAFLKGELNGEVTSQLQGRIALIPYQSLGNCGDLLPAFQPDRIIVRLEGRQTEQTDVLVGVSSNRISSDGQFQGLLHPDMVITIKEAIKHERMLGVVANEMEHGSKSITEPACAGDPLHRRK
jgi:stage II sporulation protein GA (sporulation sigma-E factor processing peptidase)